MVLTQPQWFILFLSIFGYFPIPINSYGIPPNETMGLDHTSAKYNPWHVSWPDARGTKLAIYNYQTTYWVLHYKEGEEDFVGQRWNCPGDDVCRWYVHKDEAKPGLRRFQNVHTGDCLRVGAGDMNCEGDILSNTGITGAPCKSYAEDNCQYFSQGVDYISSSGYTYYQMRINSYSKNNCVVVQTGGGLRLYKYACDTQANPHYFWFSCQGGC